ncbi:D-alanyl-D-alanine dipeptidase [Oligella urethralis]|uniref:D-alanyl-D-alanine dipeptidase n=1 Tax=Oligella urethralis TaxID=90245 RepID=UPI00288A4A9B|nr:D-alanyl-D-alanine dipeptidase [Oligella urethralis]
MSTACTIQQNQPHHRSLAPALVEITEAEFGVKLELVYATRNNLTNERIYQDAVCAIHRDVAPLVKKAAEHAQRAGYTLLIYDGYRPPAAQAKLWQALPDPMYIVPPEIGSNHSRGTAIDVTLIDNQSGQVLDMGTGFDDMSHRSHHDVAELSLEVQRNRLILLAIMLHAGFKEIESEWWHYELPDASSYPLIECDFIRV